MSEKKKNFGYVDDQDESLKSKSGGVFGLNTGYITKFEYNPNAGKDGAEADAIDIYIQIAEKEFRSRIYNITGELFGKNSVKFGPDDKEYTELYNKEMSQRNAVAIHVAKSLGVTDDTLKKAFAQDPEGFVEWAKIITSLPSDDAHTKVIDVFLEYQWEMKDGTDRTYLKIPENMKGGRFLCPTIAQKGEWTAVEVKGGLVYKDEVNSEHPFTRSANYMESPKANRQVEGEEVTTKDQEEVKSTKKKTW